MYQHSGLEQKVEKNHDDIQTVKCNYDIWICKKSYISFEKGGNIFLLH